MIHKACMPVYMNSGKIVADGRDGTGGKIEGSTRGPRGPKKGVLSHKTVEIGSSLLIHSFRNVFKEFLFDLLQECSDLKEIHLKSQNGGNGWLIVNPLFLR